MAAMLVVGLGLGAEKLGRKISEKRLERKAKKAAEKRELMYGSAESGAPNTGQDRSSRGTAGGDGAVRRRSISSERTLVPEEAPPRYEEVIRENRR